jgi:hypothetical protein
MSRRRLTSAAVVTSAALVTVLGTATTAAADPADKAQVLAGWTQTGSGSQNTFLAARADQGSWAAYNFDWSTDVCSSSPDNPFGFPFENSCIRHDFGYRNYKAMGTFEANKDRIDSAFYEDLKRACTKYDGAQLSACNALARTYYEAVRVLGIQKNSPVVG